MWEAISKMIVALQKPHAIRATILVVIIAITLVALPEVPELMREYTDHLHQDSCADTALIVEAMVQLNIPQTEISIRSFLLQHYHPAEQGMNRQEVKALMETKLRISMEQTVVNLNNLHLCFDNVGDWYRDTFEHKEFTNKIVDLMLFESTYTSSQERESSINRIMNLVEATVHHHQAKTLQILRDKLEVTDK